MHLEKPIYSVARSYSNVQQSTKHTGREFGTPLDLKSPKGHFKPTRDSYEDWKNHEVYLTVHLVNVLNVLGRKDILTSKMTISNLGKDALGFAEMAKICAKLNDWSTKMEFKDKTYFIARYLAFISQSITDLSLSVCLFIADKYEELYMKTWDMHLKVAGISASNQDVISEEVQIIQKANFYVHRPRLHYILIQTLKSSQALDIHIELANSILKTILIEEKVFSYPIKTIVLIIVEIVAKVTGNSQINTRSIALLGKISKDDDDYDRYYRIIKTILRDVLESNDSDLSPFKQLLSKHKM